MYSEPMERLQMLDNYYDGGHHHDCDYQAYQSTRLLDAFYLQQFVLHLDIFLSISE